MRKIESQMNQAIRFRRPWHSSNTMVAINGLTAEVFLHGNLIATISDEAIKLFDGGWQTTTTKSRLNAILQEFGLVGERVFQKNFEWFLRHRDGSVQPFRSGMRLA